MSTKYVLALDQGTTSSRAILFDNEQNIIAVQQREFEQIYPQQGWVEHNPMEIWSTQYGVMNEVVAQSGVDVHDIAAIGITNQRETTIPVSYTHLKCAASVSGAAVQTPSRDVYKRQVQSSPSVPKPPGWSADHRIQP